MRKKVLTREQFDRLFLEERSRAFTVTGVNRLDVLQHVLDRLTDAVAHGDTLADFAGNLDEVFSTAGLDPVSPWRGENIFRTGTQSAYGRGRWEQMNDPDLADDVWGWTFRTVGDDRVRDEHAALEGHHFRTGEGDAYFPPIGFNCVLPGTLLRGSFQVGCRMLYAGEIVEIETRDSPQIRVTRNHPVPTVRGLVPAHFVQKGERLLRYVGDLSGVSDSAPVDWKADDQYAPARADEIFKALAVVGCSFRRGRINDWFHGDAVFGIGDVDVVAANGELARKAVAQSVGNLALKIPGVADAIFQGLPGPRGGPLRQTIFGLRNSFRGRPRRRKVPLNLLSRFPDPLQALRFGSTPDLDAAIAHGRDKRLLADMEIPAELYGRSPGLVEADEVVKVSTISYTGHVYDFQSTTGFYLAEGLLWKNCRCSSEIVLRSEAEELGLETSQQPIPPEAQEELLSSDFVSPAVSYDYRPDLSGFDPGLVSQYLAERGDRGL